MLHSTIVLQAGIMAGQTVDLPTLSPTDPPASLTDRQSSGQVILMFQCHADAIGASLWRMEEGMSHEHGRWLDVHTSAKGLIGEHWLKPGETYERPLQTAYGPGILRLRHEVALGSQP